MPAQKQQPSTHVVLVRDYNRQTGVLMLRITARRVSHTYLLRRVRGDFGESFQLGKIAATVPAWDRLEFKLGEVYDLNVNGPERSCTCKGFLFTGGCKHLHALAELSADGHLSPMEVCES